MAHLALTSFCLFSTPIRQEFETVCFFSTTYFRQSFICVDTLVRSAAVTRSAVVLSSRQTDRHSFIHYITFPGSNQSTTTYIYISPRHQQNTHSMQLFRSSVPVALSVLVLLSNFLCFTDAFPLSNSLNPRDVQCAPEQVSCGTYCCPSRNVSLI